MKKIGWIPAFWRYMRDRDASIFGKLLAVFAVAYVVMPLDLIPDIAPVVGWLDDVGVVTLVGAWMMKRIAQYRTGSHVGSRDAALALGDRISTLDA